MRPTTGLRRPDAAVAAILVLAVLLGGMPLTLGIVVHSSEAMFTLDICHPVQSFSHSPVAVAAIIPDSPAVARLLPECGRYPVPRATLRVRAAAAPDPPPPETRA
ncbi:MAG TPA: hypothetical protein VNF49_02940 [Candidatus Binataceae bacterium]|nr:hypothetical protein [Candidatus Binataceae bacterium]